MTRARSVLVVVVAVVAALILTACSGVPSSTTPQVVRTLNANPAPAVLKPPAPDTSQRDIVLGFLEANADADTSHSAAQEYLTAAAAQAWKQNAGATIFDASSPSLPDRGVVRIAGKPVGSLSAGGTFSLPTGTTPVKYAFHFTHTRAGWRITNPPPGLLLRTQDFEHAYHLSPLYFFSSDQKVLVPDLRYSSANGQSLADLLLTQLINGASGGPLSNLPVEFPSQILVTSTKVTVGTLIVIQLPGFTKLTTSNRTRIAAEIAYTFGAEVAFQGKPIEIEDGTKVVPIATGEDTFSQASALFKTFDPTRSRAGQSVYYVRKGAVYNESGHPLDGVFGGKVTGVSSVAISTRESGATPLEAAVVSHGRGLMIGNAGALKPVALSGAATSRPDWTSNGPDEAWLGVGRSLMRVSSNGVVHPVQITAPQGSSALTYHSVDAIRFSPDGVRVALVLNGVGTSTSSSAWIGNVVRSAGGVSIQGLYQFTPKGWFVRDVTWTDALTLDVIDSAPTSLSFRIFSLRCDGSAQRQITSANEQLPPSPAPRWITAGITAGSQADTWVSVGTGASATLWRLFPAPNWLAPFGTSSYLGAAPVYSS